MKIEFMKTVIVVEIIVVLFCLVSLSNVFQDTSKKNLITEQGLVDYVTFRKGSNIDIYLLGKDYNLDIDGLPREAVNYSELRQLQRGDTIFFTHRKNKIGGEMLGYWLGNIEIVALESNKSGTILSLKNYFQIVSSTEQMIELIIMRIFLFLLTLAIICGWVMALMLYINPYHYNHFKDHILVQHKLVWGKVH